MPAYLRNIVAAGLAAVIVILAVQVFFETRNHTAPVAPPADFTKPMVEQQIMAQPGAEVYEVIKRGFPAEYDAHLGDLADLANDPDIAGTRIETAAFDKSRAFATALRRANAGHVAKTPIEKLVKVQQTALAILKSVEHDKVLCARMAGYGLGGMGMADIQQLDMNLISQSAVLTFEAIIAGRDTPQDHGTFTGNELSTFVEAWTASTDTPEAAARAFLDGRVDDAEAYCDGAISYQTRLIEDASPDTRRLLVEVTRVLVGN